jgi:hypothetical protein
MAASSWAARSLGGLELRDGGGVIVECNDVLPVPVGLVDSDGRGETEDEAEGETVPELGEPSVAVQPETIKATAPSTTPARRMPHILPAGHDGALRRATRTRNTALGLRAWTDEECRRRAARWHQAVLPLN